MAPRAPGAMTISDVRGPTAVPCNTLTEVSANPTLDRTVLVPVQYSYSYSYSYRTKQKPKRGIRQQRNNDGHAREEGCRAQDFRQYPMKSAAVTPLLPDISSFRHLKCGDSWGSRVGPRFWDRATPSPQPAIARMQRRGFTRTAARDEMATSSPLGLGALATAFEDLLWVVDDICLSPGLHVDLQRLLTECEVVPHTTVTSLTRTLGFWQALHKGLERVFSLEGGGELALPKVGSEAWRTRFGIPGVWKDVRDALRPAMEEELQKAVCRVKPLGHTPALYKGRNGEFYVLLPGLLEAAQLDYLNEPAKDRLQRIASAACRRSRALLSENVRPWKMSNEAQAVNQQALEVYALLSAHVSSEDLFAEPMTPLATLPGGLLPAGASLVVQLVVQLSFTILVANLCPGAMQFTEAREASDQTSCVARCLIHPRLRLQRRYVPQQQAPSVNQPALRWPVDWTFVLLPNVRARNREPQAAPQGHEGGLRNRARARGIFNTPSNNKAPLL